MGPLVFHQSPVLGGSIDPSWQLWISQLFGSPYSLIKHDQTILEPSNISGNMLMLKIA
jgi:hypothetical protein